MHNANRDKQERTNTEVTRMKATSSSTPMPMTLRELNEIITRCGGKDHARTYAAPLLARVRLLEARGTYGLLLNPIRTAGDQADLRGRLLEINLAYQFEHAGVTPDIASKQGGTGDIDFRFDVGQYEIFLETKLLQQERATTARMNAQLAATSTYAIARNTDLEDVFRIQRDLIEKATTKKFGTKPKSNWINLVGVDVSELQLGTVDIFDCIIAAAGSSAVAAVCRDPVRAAFLFRSNVIGVFEARSSSMNPEQVKWTTSVDRLVKSDVHPQDYIHGAVFLFREPNDTAALVYELTAAVVWNSMLVKKAVAREVEPIIHQIVPRLSSRK